MWFVEKASKEVFYHCLLWYPHRLQYLLDSLQQLRLGISSANPERLEQKRLYTASKMLI